MKMQIKTKKIYIFISRARQESTLLLRIFIYDGKSRFT